MSPIAVRFSTALSLVEVGLGSLLHALHVPFRGQALSMNQGFLLSRASFVGADSRREGVRLSNLISLTAACLKSLSPAGQRLNPMLAISMQGLLFSVGQMLGGITVLGHSIGISLVSFWAMSQGLILGWFLNGGKFFEALKYIADKITGGRVEWVLGVGGLFILIVGVGLVMVSRRMSAESWKRYEERFQKRREARVGSRKFSIPWIAILSVLVTVGFLYYTEAPEARSIWIWVRPVGIFVLMTWIVASIPPKKIADLLGRRWPELAKNVESAHRALLGQID